MIWIVWWCDDYTPQGFFTSERLAKEFVEGIVADCPFMNEEDYVIEPVLLNKAYTT